MTFPKSTIKRGTALIIFQGADIAAHDSRGNRIPSDDIYETKVASYSAQHPRADMRITDTSLTNLCARLWSLASDA